MLPSIFLGLIAGLFTTSAKRGAMAGAVVGVAIALLYVSAARGLKVEPSPFIAAVEFVTATMVGAGAGGLRGRARRQRGE